MSLWGWLLFGAVVVTVTSFRLRHRVRTRKVRGPSSVGLFVLSCLAWPAFIIFTIPRMNLWKETALGVVFGSLWLGLEALSERASKG